MFTYDTSTDRGRIRLLIPDRHVDGYLFEDEEIDTFLAMEGDIRRATALALETIASDEAMVLKVIHLQDLSTNGPAVSAALLSRAAALRQQAEADEEERFDIAEMVTNQFGYREYMRNQGLRGL